MLYERNYIVEHTIQAEYLSLADVQEKYSLSRSSLYRILNEGKIEAIKIGRSTRIKASSVAEFFANAPKYTASH
ncbi:helix-turn-helix domain-containing protein [Acetobacteraceae bacterium]|nr:helix-turn-helix domain-containing protein [Acetobacteraceae bacterium]